MADATFHKTLTAEGYTSKRVCDTRIPEQQKCKVGEREGGELALPHPAWEKVSGGTHHLVLMGRRGDTFLDMIRTPVPLAPTLDTTS